MTEKRRPEINPMIYAAVYAFTMPLIIAGFALWLPLKTQGVETLREWQTLVAGIIAILAACAGGAFVANQTAESRRQERDRIGRAHAAARAVMPLGLDGIHAYAQSAVQQMESLRSVAKPGLKLKDNPAAPFTPPRLPAEEINVLRDAIASSPESMGRRIAALISDIQVLHARLRPVHDQLQPASTSILTIENLDEFTLNAVIIAGRCAELYPYARDESDIVPPGFPREHTLTNTLRIFSLDESTHPNVFHKAAIRAKRKAAEAAASAAI